MQADEVSGEIGKVCGYGLVSAWASCATISGERYVDGVVQCRSLGGARRWQWIDGG